jgi:prevent-host-death family protein
MNSISITKARETLADLVNTVYYRDEMYLLTRRNKKLAALIPPKQLRIFVKLLRLFEDEIDHEDTVKALNEARNLGTISHDEVKRELGL